MYIDYKKLKFKINFLKKQQSAIAIVTVIIGQFEVRGFKVAETKYKDKGDKFVLFPPANRGAKTWIKIFFIQEKAEWEKFEKVALEKFEEEYREYLVQSAQ